MAKSKYFSAHIAALVILFVFFEASAFAESRHLRGTRSRSHLFSGRSFSRPSFHRSAPRSFSSGRRFVGRGRIERVLPYRGGYRVWLGGWGYPFYVPYRYYDPFRFRLGLFIGFNAFYDPLGYYSVYGWPGPVYRRAPEERIADVRGTVVSIDLQSGIVVVDDNDSRREVRALLPPRDRRVDEIRAGDYVELSGRWVRGRDYELDAARMETFEPKR